MTTTKDSGGLNRLKVISSAPSGGSAISFNLGKQYLLNNSTGAVWVSLTNLAVLQNGENPDIAPPTSAAPS